jgi:uncharacterized membrane protein
MTETNNLIVLMFQGQATAAAAFGQLEQMEQDKVVKIKDAIILERDAEDSTATMTAFATASGEGVPPATALDDKVRVIQTHGKKGNYAVKGGGIGFLAGLLLGGPIAGLAIGAGLGAITAGMRDLGIDDKNIEMIRSRLQPDSSALLVLGTAQDKDAFVAGIRTYDPQVVSSSLPPEMEKQLREQLEG